MHRVEESTLMVRANVEKSRPGSVGGFQEGTGQVGWRPERHCVWRLQWRVRSLIDITTEFLQANLTHSKDFQPSRQPQKNRPLCAPRHEQAKGRSPSGSVVRACILITACVLLLDIIGVPFSRTFILPPRLYAANVGQISSPQDSAPKTPPSPAPNNPHCAVRHYLPLNSAGRNPSPRSRGHTP